MIKIRALARTIDSRAISELQLSSTKNVDKLFEVNQIVKLKLEFEGKPAIMTAVVDKGFEDKDGSWYYTVSLIPSNAMGVIPDIEIALWRYYIEDGITSETLDFLKNKSDQMGWEWLKDCFVVKDNNKVTIGDWK